MTAKYYNLTKQNGTVMKARRRFTKQNGVVKQILNGWTKRNGNVEQVYTTTHTPSFFTLIANASGAIGQTIGFATEDYLIYDNYLAMQSYYWADGSYQQIGTEKRIVGFNYANGNTSEKSAIIRSPDTSPYMIQEMKEASPGIVTGQTVAGYLGSFIKIRTNNYVMLAGSPMYGARLDYISDTGTSSESLPGIFNLATYRLSALTLYDGRGIWLRNAADGNLADSEYGVYEYDGTLTNKVTYTQLFVLDQDETDCMGSVSSRRIFTPNGQDCVFTVITKVENQGTTTYYTRLCKYNTQTKTATVTKVSGTLCMLGTYNGYIYIAHQSSGNYLGISKYDISFNLIATHNIPLQSGYSYMASPVDEEVLASSVVSGNSNTRYVAIEVWPYTPHITLVLDLSLF